MKLHTTIETAMRISQMQRVTVHMLRDRFNMSRATAYRWLAAWRASKGIY